MREKSGSDGRKGGSYRKTVVEHKMLCLAPRLWSYNVFAKSWIFEVDSFARYPAIIISQVILTIS